MSETVNLLRQVLGANTYPKVIDTTFTEFVNPTPAPVAEATVEDFFRLYDTLFFQIPVTGEINSHEYLVKTSSEYIGGDIISDNEKALLEEINSLRQQLLEANQSLIDISKLT
jgi:hypothetical protein